MTIAVHPPSTTHRQLDSAALAAAGIREGLIRVSVGLEDADDLINDFEQALSAAVGSATGIAVAPPA
jgi:O-acetylhomoserine (thiol)-lyase